MSELSIARRYAKSLLDLAGEEKKLEKVVEDSKTILAALESRDLVLLLRSPIIKADKKLKALSTIFSANIDDLTIKFITIITKKGREGLLPEIVSAVIDQYNIMNNVSTAKLTTAVSVDQTTIDSIKDKLQSGEAKMEIETAIDPNIIGGYILEMGDTVYDASVKRQISDLRKELING
jgi:F-type H+-transporting ATPase subunit delta